MFKLLRHLTQKDKFGIKAFEPVAEDFLNECGWHLFIYEHSSQTESIFVDKQ